MKRARLTLFSFAVWASACGGGQVRQMAAEGPAALADHAALDREEVRNAPSAHIHKGSGTRPYYVMINDGSRGIERTEAQAQR